MLHVFVQSVDLFCVMCYVLCRDGLDFDCAMLGEGKTRAKVGICGTKVACRANTASRIVPGIVNR